MRFMMFMYPGKHAESGEMPDPNLILPMMKYNEELTKAGVLIAVDGLHPSAKGARIHFTGGKPKVTDGPFTEAKELVGGYWMIQAKSTEEAVEWAKRAPCPDGEMIEVRRVFEMSEFNVDPESELAGRFERLGAVVGRKAGKV